MDSHIEFLERKIQELGTHDHPLSRPTQFEYYSAIHLSLLHHTPFYVWKDLTPLQKEKAGFPVNDKGIDVAEDSFHIIGQAKYYGERKSIGYGTLATFLGMPILSGRTLNLHLLRTDHSCLSSEIKRIVEGGRLHDIPLSPHDFQEACQHIQKKVFSTEEKKEEFTLKPPQKEAKQILIQSDLEKRNAIIHLPTGLGKTILFLDYERPYTGCTLILVPTLVLVKQWFEEACKMGFSEKTIYRIGSEDHNTFTTDELSHRLVICVFNSCPLVLPYMASFRKVVVDEAHRVFSSIVYKDEDEEDDEEDEEDDEEEEEEEDEEEEEEEDEEDEEEDDASTTSKESSYLSQLRSVIRENNKTVLLSATIEPISDWLYYTYSVREAITAGYITDYQLVCPIFNDDPTDQNVAEYLIRKGETHCIIYTSSIEKCEAFTETLNRLLPNSAQFLHSGISKRHRERILSDFEEGTIRFIVNVRVLAEGFNSTLCSSIVFLHMSSNDIFIIQCIGRALRLHPDKTVATIYLPFHTEHQEHQISAFLQHLCKGDPAFERVCSSKTVGTYISLERVRGVTEEETEEDEDSITIEHRYDLVFDSMGNPNGVELWERRREEWVRVYERLGKTPSAGSKNPEEKRAASWQGQQRICYKKGKMPQERIQILEETDGWKWKEDAWTIQWEHWKRQTLLGKTPSQGSKNPEEKRAAIWRNTQRQEYKKGKMPPERIHLLEETDGWKWEEDVWTIQWEHWERQTLLLGKRPSEGSKNPEEKRAAQWQNQQRIYYKKGKMPQERIHLLEEMDGWKWEEEDTWPIQWEHWKQQYLLLGKKPSETSKNPEEKRAGSWQNTQRQEYKKGKMPPERIHLLEETDGWKWEDDSWPIQWEHWKRQTLLLGKTPSTKSKNTEERRAAQWQSDQRHNYKKGKMLQERIQILNQTPGWKWKWEDDSWSIQFEHWKSQYRILGKPPSNGSKNPEEKRAASWQSTQRHEYKKGKMPQERIQILEETNGWKWAS